MATVASVDTPITFSGLASGLDTSSIITKMTQIAQQPITQLTTTDDGYNTKLQAWQSFNNLVVSFQSAAQTMTLGTTFNAATASSSSATVASITSSAGATLGDHTLTVNQLAQAQKLVTSSFASSTAGLNLVGTFNINGKTVSVLNTDTLTDIAASVNKASAGVTAAVVNVGANDFRITVTANTAGTANAISATDANSGTILSSLGLINSGAATTARQALSYTQSGTTYTGAASIAMGNYSQNAALALGLKGTAPSGTVQINGVNIDLDLNKDSLNDIAGKINAASITGVTAQLVGVTDSNGNVTRQQLQIVNATTAPAVAAAPTFTDSNNVLSTLGVVQATFTNAPIAGAKDAKFNLDGLDLTRSTNTIGDVLTGSNIKLLQAGTVAAPASTTLTVAQKTDTLTNAVNGFISAYNTIQDYVSTQNKFTAPTGDLTGTAADSPPLFGDSTLAQIQNQLSRTLSVSSGNMTLADIGVTLGTDGKLTLDSDKLTTAFTNDPTKVANLFGSVGTPDDANVKFVSSTVKTQSTSGVGYAVNIYQAATQSALVAGTKQTGASTAAETLTFGGSQFAVPVKITLAKGNTLQDTVNQINSDSALNGIVSASIDPSTQKLKLVSQAFGSGTEFGVNSDMAASATSSGIGLSSSSTNGVDVGGTINGELATGKGRILTGNVGNKFTEGLSLSVTATTPGSYGHVSVAHGVADAIGQAVTQILDPDNGSIIGAENSLNSLITATEKKINDMNDEVTNYTTYLQTIFSNMESRISELQSQGAAFAALAGTSTTSSSKSTSSSSSSSAA